MSNNLKKFKETNGALTFLLELLKEFELAYNLSPKLSPKEVAVIKKKMLEIVNNLELAS